MTERTITIRGEVQFPGVYKYADNETVEDFIIQAGGLTDKASLSNVSISRRVSDSKAVRPDSVIARTFNMALKENFAVDGDRSFTLMPFDEVYVMRSPGYTEQQNVTVEGEVLYAGTYALERNNTRLSDLFRMSGGSNGLAYIKGARLMRKANEAEKARAAGGAAEEPSDACRFVKQRQRRAVNGSGSCQRQHQEVPGA